MVLPLRSVTLILASAILSWTSSCLAQTSLAHAAQAQQQSPAGAASAVEQPKASPILGSIRGIVVDQSGAVVGGARVRLNRGPSDGQSPAAAAGRSEDKETLTAADGQFLFTDVSPGAFQLTVVAAGFATRTFSAILQPGQIETVPPVALEVAENVTEMQVGENSGNIAEEQIRVEEKQRVFGALPNFYVSYVPDAAPLSPKQKFNLAWKTVIDPFTIVIVAGAAGVEQAQNHFAAYGQGAQGYAKRFGAGYADAVAGTMIGAAILPSLLKQDPRYFYKGTGSVPSRALYAVVSSVACKGDNGRRQPNYSNILGSLAAGAISNLYYPAQDRSGTKLTFENGAIGLGATAVANLFEEFLIRKLTPKASNPNPGKP